MGLIFLISLNSIKSLYTFTSLTRFQTEFNTLVTESLVDVLKFQMLPLVILCGMLVSLSFARDYEDGLIQTLLSLPISRPSVFIVKFVAVIIPLTFLSWGLSLFAMLLNFHSISTDIVFVVESTFLVLPITLLAVMFYAGLAALVALVLKRAIPSVLTTVITGFAVWFITTLTPDVLGPLADYLIFTPYSAPTVALGRILGMKYPESGLETALPAWGYLVLIVFYAFVLVVPAYLYFVKKFEVKE